MGFGADHDCFDRLVHDELEVYFPADCHPSHRSSVPSVQAGEIVASVPGDKARIRKSQADNPVNRHIERAKFLQMRDGGIDKLQVEDASLQADSGGERDHIQA